MLQALWSLEVLLADEAVPAGVVIFHLRRVFGDYFQAGRLFGGDSHCHYVGDYQIENLGLTGRFTTTRHGGVEPTPIGPNEEHRVTFTGTLEANLERDVHILDAVVDGDESSPIKLRLTRRAALA